MSPGCPASEGRAPLAIRPRGIQHVDRRLAQRSAAVLAFVFGIGVAPLITSLFLGMQPGRDRRIMGTLSAIGFTAREVDGQVRGRTLLLAVVGIALGVAAVAVGSGALVGGLLPLAGLGIVRLDTAVDPLFASMKSLADKPGDLRDARLGVGVRAASRKSLADKPGDDRRSKKQPTSPCLNEEPGR